MDDAKASSPEDRLIFSSKARSDLREIRTFTRQTFGEAATERYDALLKQAFIDIAKNVTRPGSRIRPELGQGIYSYHIALSKDRTKETVKNPRHFILYFESRDDKIVVSRVLHDSRDLKRHAIDRAGKAPTRNPGHGRERDRGRER